MTHTSVASRAERFRLRENCSLRIVTSFGMAQLADISRSGMACVYLSDSPAPSPGTALDSIVVDDESGVIDFGSARVARSEPCRSRSSQHGTMIGIAFDVERPELLQRLRPSLQPYGYVTGELAESTEQPNSSVLDPTEHTLDQFYSDDSPDVFSKCGKFSHWIQAMLERQYYQRFYRVTLTGPISNRITAFDPICRRERVLVCFDSNSYLGLHEHPKVVEEVRRVVNEVGFGTPSAQLLCGTNRYLRELEQSLCEFHGREATLVFPSGFAANSGAIRALVRSNDLVVRDQLAHASIHEACHATDARMKKVFAHNRPASLAAVLRRAQAAGCSGKLVATDGVFSMHGRIAPLPDLVQVCAQFGARLMVDDAHGVGVIGATGRGIEEHFGMPGAVDVLMGTLSKALGGLGGYVSGSRDLIDYLRWFAPSGLFTTALPAPLCAGARAALEIITSEPEHQQRLWQNIQDFAPALRRAGFIVSDGESPIVTVYIGRQKLLWDVSRELFDAGIKCGNVIYPAVGKSDCILRFTMNAKHSAQDIEHALTTMVRVGKHFDILGRTREELHELARPTSRAQPLAS